MDVLSETWETDYTQKIRIEKIWPTEVPAQLGGANKKSLETLEIGHDNNKQKNLSEQKHQKACTSEPTLDVELFFTWKFD